MKKKYVIAGITCSFLLITGICYSCAYNKDTSGDLVTSLAEGEDSTGVQSKNIIEADEFNLTEANSDQSQTETEASDEPQESTNNSLDTSIYVHVCGAVVKPGVYQAANGARLFDMIKLAGGLAKNAAGDYINQAQSVTDGQRIYIPTEDEVEEISVADYTAGEFFDASQSAVEDTNTSGNTEILVNINTATAEELMSLPGIGQAKADSIIDYRSSNGDFKTIEDLMSIPGIKEGLFGKISSYIIAK
ncbi:MAG: hypothetical protein K0S01_2782 [Herbinix sp.]|nr:hypothetical protein [Herbinix sp.]